MSYERAKRRVCKTCTSKAKKLNVRGLKVTTWMDLVETKKTAYYKCSKCGRVEDA